MPPHQQGYRNAIVLHGFLTIPTEEWYELEDRMQNTLRRTYVMKPDPQLGCGRIFAQITNPWIEKAVKLREKYPGVKLFVLGMGGFQRISAEFSVRQAHSTLVPDDEWPIVQISAITGIDQERSHGDDPTRPPNEHASEQSNVEQQEDAIPECIDLTASSQMDASNSEDSLSLRMPACPSDLTPRQQHSRRKTGAPETREQVKVMIRGQQGFQISFLRGGIDMLMERSKMDNDNFTKSLPSPIPILNPKVDATESIILKEMVSNLLLMAQAYVEGTSPYYIFVVSHSTNKSLRAYFQGEAAEWLGREYRENTHGHLEGYSSLEDLARRFCAHFDLQAIHPFTLFVRFNEKRGNGKSKPCTYATGKQYAMACSALLRIFDITNGSIRPIEVKHECWWAIQDLRYSEWVNLIGMYMLEKWDAMISIKAFQEQIQLLYESTYPITGVPAEEITANGQKREYCKTLISIRFGVKIMASRAAGGARPTGNALAEDLVAMDCLPKLKTDRTVIITTDELKAASWIALDFQETIADKKRKRSSIKTEDGQERETIKTALTAFDNGGKIATDRTLVLRGPHPTDENPVADFEAIEKVWRQDISYSFTAFQGIIVTQAAYRHLDSGDTELRLTFASREHMTAACLLLPLWLPHLRFTNTPAYVYTKETAGCLHPLSALKAKAEHLGCTMPFQVQRAFLHPKNEYMPEAVAVTKMVEQNFEAKVKYPNPTVAAHMIGKKVIVYGVGVWPYRAERRTAPLEGFFAPNQVEHCAKCGGMGHFVAQCKAPPRLDGPQCPTCTKMGQPHPKDKPCPLRNAFNANTFKTLHMAHEAATKTGIYRPGPDAEKMREKLFGKLSDLPVKFV